MKKQGILKISMSSIHNRKTISKVLYGAGIIIISIAFLFTTSQYVAHAHTGTNFAAIEHCAGSDTHVHPSVSDTPICSGTLTYAISNFYEGANVFAALLQTLVGIVVTAAFFYFFWNLVKYIRDEEGKDEAKTKMGYSLGAIFVIVTLWGIIAFVRGILGINTEDAVNTIDIPRVNFIKDDGTVIEEITVEEE